MLQFSSRGGSAWSGGGFLPGRGGSPCWGGGGLPGPGREFSGDPPSVNRITDTCKDITLATTSLRPVIIDFATGKSTTQIIMLNTEHWQDVLPLSIFMQFSAKIMKNTRMHSSRMHTARSLTVSHSICHARPLPCMSPHHAWPPPPWTEFLTHPSENITLPQLRCGR